MRNMHRAVNCPALLCGANLDNLNAGSKLGNVSAILTQTFDMKLHSFLNRRPILLRAETRNQETTMSFTVEGVLPVQPAAQLEKFRLPASF